jgi:toxin ParE1/3/4
MRKVYWTDRADSDVDEIARYISRDSRSAAFRWIDSVYEKLDLLVRFPGMGRMRPELRPGLRSLPFGNYVIYYTPVIDGIAVIRVVHGARDADALFEE